MSGPLKQAVLEPVRLADPQHVAGGLERGHVGVLVRVSATTSTMSMIGLAASPGTAVEPDVLELQRPRAERGADPRCLALEEPRPLGVVLGEVDRRVVLDELADHRSADLLVAERGGHASDGSAGPTPVLPGGGETEDATPTRQNGLRARAASPCVAVRVFRLR